MLQHLIWVYTVCSGLSVLICRVSTVIWSKRISQKYSGSTIEYISLTLVLLNPDVPCLCKQCRSRSVGFWRLICTVCHSLCEFIATIWIKWSDWLTVRNGRGILIYSAWQVLKQWGTSQGSAPLILHPNLIITRLLGFKVQTMLS